MECVINGLSLLEAQSFAGSAERKVHQPARCERWLFPSMEFLFTGRAAFRKLERIVGELSGKMGDSLNVVVVLLPQNLTIKEIVYTETNTIFLYDGHASSKFTFISISNGQPFAAAIDIIPKKSRARLVTGFSDKLYSPVDGFYKS
jgi:hypothetical protein